MGVGPGMIGGVIGLAGSGMSAMGQMKKANIEARNAENQGVMQGMQAMWQAGQLNIDAAMNDLHATQTDLTLRRKNYEQMGQISAVMAMTGSSYDSPSNAAVRGRFETLNDNEREHATWNYHMQAQQNRNMAKIVMLSGMINMSMAQQNAGAIRSGGRMSAIGGMLGGLGGLFG